MKLKSTLLLLMGTAVVFSGWGQEPDFWQAERDLTELLWTSNTPIAKVISGVSAPATNGQAAMFKVTAFLRAGMNEEAAVAVRELKRLRPNLDNYQVSSLYYDACDHKEAWDFAQAVVEVFAENITDLTLENRLLKHWLSSGWTVDQVDKWLAARPAGIHSFWIKERLRFARSQGRGEALLEQWADRVRRNPTTTNAVVFLDALVYARQGEAAPDLSWMTNFVRPARALEAQAMAERLEQLENWAPALSYYRQAITIPLTEIEIGEQSRQRQVSIPENKVRAEFAVGAREAMAQCLVKLGRNDAAQEKLVEAADIREQHGLSLNALLAGSVQAESGSRTIEQRVIEAERKSENDPEYWRERAQYFRGRREVDLEEQALKKALTLTKPRPLPERAPKGYADLRASALVDYAKFLARHEREKEAVALLRQEMADAPATAGSSERAAYLMAFDFNNQVSIEDEVLWSWLGNRATWGYTEERLLWRMLENAAPLVRSTPTRPLQQIDNVPNDKLDQSLARAERLVESGGPSRAYTLGWIMNRLHFPKRSLPLLKRAVATARDAESKERAAFALLESLLDTGGWKEAEVMMYEAARRMTPSESPHWHSRLAVAAARDGAKADALRLWFRAANVSPTMTVGLTELASLGLRDDLIAFYRSMRREMPASLAAGRALKLLQSQSD